MKKSELRTVFTLVMGLSFLFVLFIGVSFTTDYVVSADNITNISVLAKLNVTNTPPNITAVSLNDDDTATPEIDLVSNDVRVVTCNATVFDFNGWEDIDPDSTNATLYIDSVGHEATDDNNDHYTNSSCGRCTQVSSTVAGCDCRFAMQYYANDSSNWQCNISVTDRGGTGLPGEALNFTDFETSDLTTVTRLLALDTETTILDYGNLSVTQTSESVRRNVTNVGNVDFNLSLRSFGGVNGTGTGTNDNYTMLCQLGGNISFENHRYAVGTNTSFDSKFNLSNNTIVRNFTFPQRVEDSAVGRDRNFTFWQLQIPITVGGICNGTIIFGAVES